MAKITPTSYIGWDTCPKCGLAIDFMTTTSAAIGTPPINLEYIFSKNKVRVKCGACKYFEDRDPFTL